MKAALVGVVIATGGLLASGLALVGFVAFAAGSQAEASAVVTVAGPSDEALADIPPEMLDAYLVEAPLCEGLPWNVLAAIGKIETDHGRVVLATAPAADTPTDAVAALRTSICPTGQITDLRTILSERATADGYVDEVIDWARRYAGPLTALADPIAGYALPVAAGAVTEQQLAAPHHDYPASDLGVPVGTPVFAFVDGTITAASSAGIYPADPNRCGNTVILSGIDGTTVVYCHLAQIVVRAGQIVDAGTLLGLSGGLPGALGAGNTTGAHLHLSIRLGDAALCPQPLLLAIARGRPLSPATAPLAGCVQGRPTTDWPTWLDLHTPPTDVPEGTP